MRDLFPYYERELSFMREMAGEFAKRHPEVASRLDLERYRCDDPHVERLIEAFCLIASRIHQRLDSDFPEITQAFLGVLYPHYLRPIPSMSIAQFRLEPEGSDQVESVRVPAAEMLNAGEVCQFRTCYPVEVWPLRVEACALLDSPGMPVWASRLGGAAAIRISLQCKSGFSKLKGFNDLRFYLSGDGPVPFDLYELLFNHCKRILLRDPAKGPQAIIELPLEALRPVGFERYEEVIPYDASSFLGFRLLQEYFSFPEKFSFLDLGNLDRVANREFGEAMEILFLLDDSHFRGSRFYRLQHTVGATNFLLGCAPIVNLFKKAAEPIRIDQTKAEYRIVPDLYRPDSSEVYSVDSVTSRSFGSRQTRVYRPLYSFQHAEVRNGDERFWVATRRHAAREGDRGSDMYLSLVDLEHHAGGPANETLLVDTTCTNRDMPADLAFTYKFGELGIADSRVRARCLRRPTAPVRVATEKNLDWKLISHLGLNHLSLANEGTDPDSTRGQSADSLREILELYNFSNDPGVRRRLLGIQSVSSRPTRARLRMERGRDIVPFFCHGTAVTIDFDEEPFVTSGLFLLASVLERFFALYSPINSFTQVTATVDGGRRVLRQWAPRSGQQVLL